MGHWFKFIEDWERKKVHKAVVLHAMKGTPPGCHLRLDARDPKTKIAEPTYVRAVIELLKENPGWFDIMNWDPVSGSMTLMRRPDLAASMSYEEQQYLRSGGRIIGAKEAVQLGHKMPGSWQGDIFNTGITDDPHREGESPAADVIKKTGG